MEFEGVRPNPNLSLVTSVYMVPDAKVSHVGSKGLDHRNLRQKIYLLGSFDGNWKRPAQLSKNAFASAALEFHMQGKTH